MKLKKILIFGMPVVIILAAALIVILNYSSILHQIKNYVSKKFVFKGFNEKLLAEYYLPQQKNLNVRHYDLHLDLFPKKKSIVAEVIISGILDKPSHEIYLNFYDNLKISKLSLNGNPVDFENSGTHLKIFSDALLKDTFNVAVEYSGEPKSLGFGSFEFGETEGKSLIYSLSEPVFASTWFPCNDLPTDKALADVYITNDSSSISVSNGFLAGQSISGSKKTYHWKTLYPIATYLIAIYSAPYKTFEDKFTADDGKVLPLVYYVMPGKLSDARRDFEDHPAYLKFFSKTFGEYPFIKEKYGVAEFLWNMGAMESQTITGIGSKFITGKKFFSGTLIHELAHQWWGDAVTPKSWKDIWLNEGFATYSEALYWENYAGRDALISSMKSFSGKFEFGTLYAPLDNLFDRMVYDKGAWVLHMLRREMGDSTFFKILKEYYQTYKYKNASTADFENICEKISGKNLTNFFEQWVYKGKGIPELSYDWGVDSVKNKYTVQVKISQKQKLYDLFKFQLDIRFFYKNDSGFSDKSFYITTRDTILKINFKKRIKKIELDPESWLLTIINQEKQK